MAFPKYRNPKTLVYLAFVIVVTACGGGSSSGGGGDDVTPVAGVDNFDFILDDGFTDAVDETLSSYVGTVFEQAVTPLNSIENIFDSDQVPVTYGFCGFANAFYLPSERSIILCHEFAQFGYSTFLEEFEELGTLTQAEAENSALVRTYDMMIFVLYHEMGHAFDDIRDDVPIGGNFESVADAIAVVLSAQTGLPDAAVYGAWFFYFLGGESSLVDEHGSNIDRAGDIMCWIIGSSPSVASGLNSWVDAFDDEGRDCTAEYASQYQFVEGLIPDLANVPQASTTRARGFLAPELDYTFVNSLATIYEQRAQQF